MVENVALFTLFKVQYMWHAQQHMPVISVFGKLRQEDYWEFKARDLIVLTITSKSEITNQISKRLKEKQCQKNGKSGFRDDSFLEWWEKQVFFGGDEERTEEQLASARINGPTSVPYSIYTLKMQMLPSFYVKKEMYVLHYKRWKWLKHFHQGEDNKLSQSKILSTYPVLSYQITVVLFTSSEQRT